MNANVQVSLTEDDKPGKKCPCGNGELNLVERDGTLYLECSLHFEIHWRYALSDEATAFYNSSTRSFSVENHA